MLPHAVMLLSNPFRPDVRVLKEAHSLAENGYHITILAWDRQAQYPQQENLSPGVTIRRIQHVSSSYAIGLRQVAPLFRFWQAAWNTLFDLKPDLLHCHDFDTLAVGLRWGRLRRIPVIYDAHEYYADLVRPRLPGLPGRAAYHMIQAAERSLARRATAVITVDEILGARYRSLNRRVLVIGHYPTRRLVERPVPVFSRPDLNLLYVGRLSTDRGLLVYLDILRRLRQAGLPARLILAGVFTPASEEARFFSLASDMTELIEFRGWVSYQDLPDLLASADLGLALLQPLPRYVAALPVKLFEYMAAGLPVLASDFPSIRQVNQPLMCGALCNPTDPQAASQILNDWSAMPELPRSAGLRGYQAVQEHYNWENLAESLVALYRDIL
jgi:glycosyltransferase involved in cell wall biosynthesis